MGTAFKEGDTVNGSYVIIKTVESSGTGTTYLASEKNTEKNVILKIISVADLLEWKRK
jgi:serine/threonine protein kinase